jgi:hypothetical protein
MAAFVARLDRGAGAELVLTGCVGANPDAHQNTATSRTRHAGANGYRDAARRSRARAVVHGHGRADCPAH